MPRTATPDPDRLLIRAVDEAKEEPGFRIDLTDVGMDDNVTDVASVAAAWAAKGYGTYETISNRHLAFTFSVEGLALAKSAAEPLRKRYRRQRLKWPEFDGTSTWVAVGFALIALVYHLLIGE